MLVDDIFPLQCVVAAIQMLSCGTVADVLDGCLQMSEYSVLLPLKAFFRETVTRFGFEYLRAPSGEDLKRIMSTNALRGFPGCIGSIDCQHCVSENCLMARVG